ncbi:MAG: phosphatase [Nanoarchaeota archaeon]
MFRNDLVFILDVDGVITDGKMWYNKDGKYLKAFGCDDFDLLREIQKYMKVVFITADKKGYPIVKKRIVDEMGWRLEIVPSFPKERWDWIKNNFLQYNVIFMADGVFDFLALSKCYYGITTKDALTHVRNEASLVVERSGGHRAVAEACLKIMDMVGVDWRKEYVE